MGSLEPLAVVGAIEMLKQRCDLNTEEATALGRRRAQDLSELYDTVYCSEDGSFGSDLEPTERIPAIPLLEQPTVEISVMELLRGTITPETKNALAGATVIAGATWERCGDFHDLLNNSVQRPGVLAHVWTISQLLAQGCAE